MHFTTADLCDLHGTRIQIARPVFRSYGGVEHCFGPIRTIRIDEDNTELVKMLRDEAGEGAIAVVDVGGAHCAVVGDTLMGYAARNGWAGIVVHGYVRDTRLTREIPVGLWGPISSKARRKLRPSWMWSWSSPASLSGPESTSMPTMTASS
nr:hypothetical protein [Nitratifractor sp.]